MNEAGVEAVATREPERSAKPQVNRLGPDDLVKVLMQGWRDFAAAPLYGLFFGGIYALGGMALLALFFALHLPYVGYPLTMGFALIVPFVAMGTYEVSRRLERHEPLTWAAVLGAVWRRSGKDLGWMALVTVFALIIWVDFAIFLFLMFYGLHVPTPHELFVEILSTQKGVTFALVGNAVGAVVAMFVFSITVVSFPLLADRDIDFVTAMITSVRCVLANPVQMTAWAALVGLFLAISMLAGFAGLFVTLPVLGHASWHLYRKLVA
jgi:uncharacterized membrane protein